MKIFFTTALVVIGFSSLSGNVFAGLHSPTCQDDQDYLNKQACMQQGGCNFPNIGGSVTFGPISNARPLSDGSASNSWCFAQTAWTSYAPTSGPVSVGWALGNATSSICAFMNPPTNWNANQGNPALCASG